jgi:hypothetical protein
MLHTHDLSTINATPFGCGNPLDITEFEPLVTWIKRGGMADL